MNGQRGDKRPERVGWEVGLEWVVSAGSGRAQKREQGIRGKEEEVGGLGGRRLPLVIWVSAWGGTGYGEDHGGKMLRRVPRMSGCWQRGAT